MSDSTRLNMDTPPVVPPPSAPEGGKHYRLAIRRPVTVAMIFLTLVVFGWKSYQQLPINLMPDISYPTLTVRTEYQGAAPEDVEQLLTRPLEETLSVVSGLVEISSISSPGLSEIVMEFTWGTDMNAAMQDVRDRLDLFEPPRDVTEKPVILRYDPTLDPVMRVAITGADVSGIADPEERERLRMTELTTIREAAERFLKSDLEAEIGIAQVLAKGGREEEVQILVDSERLKSLGVSLDMVTNALAQQNINLSGGRLREGKSEYLVRTLNEFQTVTEIRGALITTPDGRQVRMGEIAQVLAGQKERDAIVRINGLEAVMIEIYKEGDANTVQVANSLKDLLGLERDRSLSERFNEMISRRGGGQDPEVERALQVAKTLRSYFSPQATFTLISDQSRFIVGSIDEVKQTAVIGGLLALLILFLFLRQLKSTLIIGIAIPISVVAAFIPMFVREISLNIMSLGGLALGVGMLVDNSIVVLESIFRCSEEGDTPIDAAERGTHEVASAVVASTLTTIAVFLPIAFVEGVAGQLFGDLALTVTFSLSASLLVALYLIPMIASRQRIALRARGEAVWLVHAWRVARRTGAGWTFVPIVAARVCARQSGRAVRRLWRAKVGFQRRTGSTLRAAVWVVSLPILLVIFAANLILRALGAAFVAGAFLVATAILGVVWALARVLRLLLWVPLEAFDWLYRGVRSFYGVVLRGSLQVGPLILLVVAALAVHAGYLALDLGRELIPPLKQGEFGLRMEAPPGTRLEQTEQRARRIEQVILAHPEVDTVSVEVGIEQTAGQTQRGENTAEFTIVMKDPREAAQYQDAFMASLRDELKGVASEELTFTLPSLFSFKSAVELQLRGDDLEVLRAKGQEALAAVRSVAGVRDAELSVKAGYPEVIIELDRDLLAAKNISPDQVARRLRTEVQGDVATRFSRLGEKIDVRVRTDQERLSSLQDLQRLSVGDGPNPVPLASVARVDVREGPSEIRRIGQRQVVVITANVEGRDLGAVSDDIMEAVARIDKPDVYAFTLGGQHRELQTSYRSLQFALILAIFLVYVVMASQFESIWHPALVMFSVPLAFIGVVYVLYWLGVEVSIVVFIGAIVLAGIVVNNAIVLVDYINQLRARGMAKRDAIMQAGHVRLRPILMTTVTTVLGLLPMAMGMGEGAEIRRPMAITVCAGLISATLLTLVIIPVAYNIFGGRDRT